MKNEGEVEMEEIRCSIGFRGMHRISWLNLGDAMTFEGFDLKEKFEKGGKLGME